VLEPLLALRQLFQDPVIGCGLILRILSQMPGKGTDGGMSEQIY
jgi:hypothetical protein